jgi:hypothetical protein
VELKVNLFIAGVAKINVKATPHLLKITQLLILGLSKITDLP